jgi:hypothetical protein
MNKNELKQILNNLKDVVEELESAIYSDVESYRQLDLDYKDVLDYYNETANAEEGL